MKRYSNSTLVLACIAYMLLPAVPTVTATGNLQANSETKATISAKEKQSVTVPAPILTPSSLSKQQVMDERKENHEPLASRSMDSRRSNGPEVVETSKKYIGAPYARGGEGPSGFDCSGFVKYVYHKHGQVLPRSSSAMFNMGTKVTELQPGDLVFFNTSGSGVSHVGIYIGNHKFISATSKGVKIDGLNDKYWGPKYLGAKRV